MHDVVYNHNVICVHYSICEYVCMHYVIVECLYVMYGDVILLHIRREVYVFLVADLAVKTLVAKLRASPEKAMELGKNFISKHEPRSTVSSSSLQSTPRMLQWLSIALCIERRWP